MCLMPMGEMESMHHCLSSESRLNVTVIYTALHPEPDCDGFGHGFITLVQTFTFDNLFTWTKICGNSLRCKYCKSMLYLDKLIKII